jgi:hypothetical protein
MRCRAEWLFFIFLLFSLAIVSASAQPYETLTAADFRGMPKTSGSEVAYTHCSIAYSYSAKPAQGYYQLRFKVKLVMDRDQSWMDRKRITSPEMMAGILKHEQGHYDIAYLEQQELLRTVSHTVFYANYQQAAQDIFNRISAKYKALNEAYESQTAHSINGQEQQKWDAYFKRELRSLNVISPGH